MFSSKVGAQFLTLCFVAQGLGACLAFPMRQGHQAFMGPQQLSPSENFDQRRQQPGRDTGSRPSFGTRDLESNSAFDRVFADNSQFGSPDSAFAGRPLTAKPSYFKQINASTWRTRIRANVLYPLIVRHLSESYILKTSDSRAMNIQTDWDKFFIGGRLFRNRLSVSLFQLSAQDTELVVNNKVEYFQQPDEAAAYGESDWIPTQDITNEKSSLIEGLGKILHAINLSAAAG